MNLTKVQIWLACGALALSSALAVDWLSGLWFYTGSWIVRCGLLGLGLILSVSAVVALTVQLRREQRAAQRFLDALFRPDHCELNLQVASTPRDAIGQHSEWQGVFERIEQCLANYARLIQQLKHARSALEICNRTNETKAERISAILENLPEPVLAIDHFDELVLANASAEKLFEIDAQATESRMLRQLVHCEKLVELLTETRRRAMPNQRSGEIELTDECGQPHWYSVSTRSFAAQTTPGNLADGASHGAVAVLRDISLQKASQKRNAEFVSAVSHEMKTPLAGIKAYVELLVDGDAEDDKTREEFLGVINSQAERLQRLVDNLLNLARIEAGVVRINKQSHSLNQLLEEALQVFGPSATARQIRLVADLSPMYLAVLADRDMMLQVANNLLSNAIKYTRPGGTVTLRSRLLGSEIRFEVEDTGVGLEPDDCDKVFEKFYRVHKVKDMAAGTGLGLPLARHIVEDVHGGKLALVSTPGQGSTFSVVLPAAGLMV